MRTRPARIHSWLVPREAMPSFESSRSTVRRLGMEASVLARDERDWREKRDMGRSDFHFVSPISRVSLNYPAKLVLVFEDSLYRWPEWVWQKSVPVPAANVQRISRSDPIRD